MSKSPHRGSVENRLPHSRARRVDQPPCKPGGAGMTGRKLTDSYTSIQSGGRWLSPQQAQRGAQHRLHRQLTHTAMLEAAGRIVAVLVTGGTGDPVGSEPEVGG